jgi:phosphoserine phosphatase
MGVKIAADKAQSVAHTRRKRLTAYKGVQQKVKSSVAQQKSITKQAAQMAPQISQKGLQKLTPD